MYVWELLPPPRFAPWGLYHAKRNPIGLALRAFLRFEAHCFRRGIRRVEAKTAIIREAVRAYLQRPHIRLPRPLTA